jgi:hypothetical protein
MKCALTLRTFPCSLIRTDCPKCGRSTQHERAVLQQRFPLDTPILNILIALTACQRWNDAADPCQMHYTDLNHHFLNRCRSIRAR